MKEGIGKKLLFDLTFKVKRVSWARNKLLDLLLVSNIDKFFGVNYIMSIYPGYVIWPFRPLCPFKKDSSVSNYKSVFFCFFPEVPYFLLLTTRSFLSALKARGWGKMKNCWEYLNILGGWVGEFYHFPKLHASTDLVLWSMKDKCALGSWRDLGFG